MPDEDLSKSYIAKAVLIGDGRAGKTSITRRFCEGKFSEDYLMTIGAGFFSGEVKTDKARVKLQIWDLAGQPRFDCVRSGYYKGASACLAVFDLTRYETFEHVSHWLNEMYKQIEPVIPTGLVGNKLDLENDPENPRQVDSAVAEEYSENLSKWHAEFGAPEVPYFETSAKTGKNVQELFQKVVEKYLETME